jgi:hypothetical protein
MNTVRIPIAAEQADELQADWLERCSRGDLDAFHELYLATAPRLLGVIALLTGRGAVAEELLQVAGVNYPGRPATTILAGLRRGCFSCR